jgi:porin
VTTRTAALALLAALTAQPAAADPRLLGDVGGLRTRLERLGIGVQLFYNQYVSGNPSGGADPRSSGSSGSYDFLTRVDTQELLEWRGLVGLLHVKGQYDRNINADVGALSDPIDDADFDEAAYIDELWLEQAFAGDRAQLRVGFLEQQTVFDRNAYANNEDRQFLSTFLDNNPIVPLPNGLGAVLLLQPSHGLELALGAADADNVPRSAGFDTAFDGLDSLTGYLEAALHVDLPGASGELPGRYRVGVFLDGREKRVFGSDRRERGHLGVYASLDQLVLHEASDPRQGLGLFARGGWADGDVNRIEWFWSAGLQYTGALPGRDHDVVGLAAYQAIGSSRLRSREDPDFDRETGIELYYRIAVFPWLAVTPDVQYVIDPGARGEHRDAVVTTMRFRVTF